MEIDSYGYKRFKYSSSYGYYGSGEFTQHLLNFKTHSGTSTTSTIVRECLTNILIIMDIKTWAFMIW